MGWGHIRLYFTDSKFMSLRPQFKLPLNENVVENNSTGYQAGEEMGAVALKFDNEQKTVTCAY